MEWERGREKERERERERERWKERVEERGCVLSSHENEAERLIDIREVAVSARN